MDEAIDYTSETVEDRGRDVDVVLDLVGGEIGHGALATLRDGGLFILVPSAAGLGSSSTSSPGDRVRVTGILVEPDRDGHGGARRARGSRSAPPDDRRDVPARAGGRAHEVGETGRTPGKLVLTVG